MTSDKKWLNSLNEEINELGIAVADSEPSKSLVPGTRRRRRVRKKAMVMTIVEHDGVLRIADGAVGVQKTGARRTSPRALGLGGEVMHTTPLSTLERNQIGGALTSLDLRLTPNQGLRELRNGQISPVDSVIETGKIFLLVHGTFSNSDNIVDQVPRAANGTEFFRWLEDRYDQVLAFDHPTLAVSPLLNAHRLNERLKETTASVDTVCHSRGGAGDTLVA